MKNTQRLKPSISFLGKEHVISVSRDLVRALGKPEYVRILKNTAKNAIAFQACTEKELLSFKVPEKLFAKDHSSSFRIYSYSFVDEIIQKNHLDNNIRHKFSGSYVDKYNAVVFKLFDGAEEGEKKEKS